ncbi:uncharacterized protein V6R79_020269 [Siganus canaliculatus]
MATSNNLSVANSSFALDLLKKLSEDDNTGNIFCSPFSISAALAMVALGAGGDTATQMLEVLHFIEKLEPKEPEPVMEPVELQSSKMQSQMETRLRMRSQIQQSTKLPPYLLQCLKRQNGQDENHAKFTELLSAIRKADAPYTLSIANRLYGEKSYTFAEKYLADVTKRYNAELEPVDFKDNAEEARNKINNWVEENTQGKIQELLGQNAVKNITKLVLVNAIYFKGKWEKMFNKEDTTDADFKMNKNDSKPVKMMRQKDKFKLASIPEINCQILEMDYEKKDLSMFILLPNEIEDETTGLEKLEKELTYQKLMEWTNPDMMHETEVDVRLPRFKMEEEYDLKEILISMGMVDAFTDKADFSGMSGNRGLVLSKAVHKAFVGVDEEGTEAAAATGVVVNERAAIISASFNADHPFLFFITHMATKSLLFAGRFSSPQ